MGRPRPTQNNVVLPISLPSTNLGIIESLERSHTKLYCAVHGMQEPASCTNIFAELPASTSYEIRLACDCTRVLTVAKHRPEPVEPVREESSRNFDAIPAEIIEIRDAMRDQRLM